ncbi:MAG TPA: heme o synthase [Candidatus Acidoferrum sp.]|nr:heme o synthase [Candidatus Acidoferrum sp.]
MLPKLKHYYHLTKPGIVYGNILTAVAGFLFAAKLQVDFRLLAALVTGTALVIASGCVFNNYLDRGIDIKMKRTSKRELVVGTVPGKHALIYAGCLGLVGFVALAFTNWLVIGIGAAALVSYVAVYGYAKRHSIYGTIVGTIPGAASLVAGYVAVKNQLDLGALLLFAAMAVWQVPHFYAIAIRRLDDYAAAGLPVWPVKKGIPKTKQQIVLFILLFATANAAMTLSGYAGYSFLVVMLAISLYWLWHGLQGWHHPDDKKWAGSMFGLSLVVLLVLSGSLCVGAILP